MFPIIKHASSHGLSVLICTIASALLIELLKPKLPNLMIFLTNISEKITYVFNIGITIEDMNVILLAAVLAVIWGIFFKISLKTKDS
jgi:hypothetical protein